MSNSELDILEKRISTVDKESIEKFDVLFSNWVNTILKDEQLSITSNTAEYILIPEYKLLSEFIDTNDNLLYWIINDYINSESDVFIDILLCEKVVNKNNETEELANSVREENNLASTRSLDGSTYIAPTFRTNALCLIKEILNDNSILHGEISYEKN